MEGSKIRPKQGEACPELGDANKNGALRTGAGAIQQGIDGRIVWFAILAYTLVYSVLAILKHQALKSTTFDLGLFDQVLWNTTRGNVLESSVLGFNFLGDHFSPILFPLAGIYLVVEDVRALLVLQSFILALPALPLYWLCRDFVTARWARIVVPLAYLLHPTLGCINLFDFHPIVVVVPCFMFAAFFLEKRSYGKMCVALAIAALAKEEVPITTAVVGLYLMVFHRNWKWGGGVFAASCAYFLFVTEIAMPGIVSIPADTDFSYIHRYEHLGDSKLEVVKNLVVHPLDSLIKSWTPLKGVQLVIFLLPMGFLPLFSRRCLLALPAFTYTYLSSRDTQFHAAYQYAAVFLPFLWYAAAGSIENLGRWWAAARFPRPLLASFGIAGALVFGVVFGTYKQTRYIQWTRPWEFMKNYHQADLDAVRKLIPPDASLSTTNTLGPQFAHREELRPLFSNDQKYYAGMRRSPYFPTRYYLWSLYDAYPPSYYERVESLVCRKKLKTLYARNGLILLERTPEDINETLAWYDDAQQRFGKADVDTKVAILAEAAERQDHIAIPLLFEGFVDEHKTVRRAALTAAGHIKVWILLPAIADLFKTDPDPEIRAHAEQVGNGIFVHSLKLFRGCDADPGGPV
ncbi:MAG: DUF2079 domain-containing protein [Polyangiaceae bacterium]|nr:DUF2079 domain-containing protein [Polyangiaceae bacterium]